MKGSEHGLVKARKCAAEQGGVSTHSVDINDSDLAVVELHLQLVSGENPTPGNAVEATTIEFGRLSVMRKELGGIRQRFHRSAIAGL